MCPHMRANVRVDTCGCLYICMYVCMFVCMCADMLPSGKFMDAYTRMCARTLADRCIRFDMYIRTNVRTNGPSNKHTDDCVLIHKMAYSVFIFIKEDFFFYFSKQCRPR